MLFREKVLALCCVVVLTGCASNQAPRKTDFQPVANPSEKEQYCSKIGYKFGTEKFADCVMKMMNSQAETRNQNSIGTGNRDSSAASRASKRRMCSRGGGQC